ncbi:hypothetical protein AB1Y20_004080 [Prymnesium parvum]|uniref:K Homology domain-containing protein n=1 Tax=Prymnesium parvum TaxID=97485 RepID=A0AB34J8X8_PRYPA
MPLASPRLDGREGRRRDEAAHEAMAPGGAQGVRSRHYVDLLRAASHGAPVLQLFPCADALLRWAEAQGSGNHVLQCPEHMLPHVRSSLPESLLWRAESDDVLAHLPEELAQDVAVAQLNLAADSVALQEDVCGAICVSYLTAADGASVEWLVVPPDAKSAAVREWELHGEVRWPSEARLRDASFAVERLVQQPGHLLLLPPCALCLRRGAGVMLQWLRVPLRCVEVALELCKRAAVPPAAGVPGWRRRQLHPPVLLATYRMLCARVRAATSEGCDRAALRSLLAVAERQLDAEEGRAAWGVELLADHAARACDHCAREIFNRCVRLHEPLVAAGARAAPNPRRTAELLPGEAADFCLQCVADGVVRSAYGGEAKLLEHAEHAELRALLDVARGLLGEARPRRGGEVESVCVQAVRRLQRDGVLCSLPLEGAVKLEAKAEPKEADAQRKKRPMGEETNGEAGCDCSMTDGGARPQHKLSRMRGGAASCDGTEEEAAVSPQGSRRGEAQAAGETRSGGEAWRGEGGGDPNAYGWDDERRAMRRNAAASEGSESCRCRPSCEGEMPYETGGESMCARRFDYPQHYGGMGAACGHGMHGCGMGACGGMNAMGPGCCCGEFAMQCVPGARCGGMCGACNGMPPAGGAMGGGAMGGGAMGGGAMGGGMGGGCGAPQRGPMAACGMGGMGVVEAGQDSNLYDVAVLELENVINSAEFAHFIEFCRMQGVNDGTPPQVLAEMLDVPKMAYKFVESNVNKQLEELDAMRQQIMAEQKSRIAEAVSRRDELGSNEVHQLVNKYLAQSLGKVRLVSAEKEKHRKTLQIQERYLMDLHRHQMQMQERAQMGMPNQMRRMPPGGFQGGGGGMWGGGPGGGMGPAPGDWSSPRLMPQEPGRRMGRPPNIEGEMGGSAAELVIDIPNGPEVNYLIGSRGKSVNELQEKTGTRIQIQREGNMPPHMPFRSVTISGGGEADRLRAQEMVYAKIKEFHESRAAAAHTHEAARSDDGRGRERRSPHMGSSHSQGSTGNQAVDDQAPLAHPHAEEPSLAFAVPSDCVGYVIGRKAGAPFLCMGRGEKINQIQAESGCKVHVDKEDVVENGCSTRKVRIVGRTPADCEVARKLVLQACELAATRDTQPAPAGFGPSSNGPPSQYRPGQVNGERATECVLSDDEIAALVAQREDCRRRKDFPAADTMRQQLWEKGIELLDKERLWQTVDGRKGHYASAVVVTALVGHAMGTLAIKTEARHAMGQEVL